MVAQVFILAAGRGARLRPWTDETPKPLLEVGGRPLIEWHLRAAASAGVREVVVNTCWLEERFVPALGDGSRWGLTIHWSHERERFGHALDTAGGIRAALELLSPTFWVVSADMWLPGFAFDPAVLNSFAQGAEAARLWLAPNPAFHPSGDFAMGDGGLARADGAGPRGTWAGVGLFRRSSFETLDLGAVVPLRTLLQEAASRGQLGLRWLESPWIDVGTVDRWDAARAAAVPGEAR